MRADIIKRLELADLYQNAAIYYAAAAEELSEAGDDKTAEVYRQRAIENIDKAYNV